MRRGTSLLLVIPALRRAQGKPRCAQAGIHFAVAFAVVFKGKNNSKVKMDPSARAARFTLSPSKGWDDDTSARAVSA